MNYYDHHIGDYDADTAHLTWAEDMAYTRLLRLYYRRERPIPVDAAEACRLIRAVNKEQKQAVESVLREFFELRDDGWHQGRCDSEISAYQQRVEHNRTVGKRGGRPRKTETQVVPEKNPDVPIQELKNNPPGFSRVSKKNPNQEPFPNNQYSVPDGTGGAAAKPAADLTREELWAAGKSLLAQGGIPEKQCGSFIGKLVKDYGDTVVRDAVRAAVVARPADPAEYLKATCMHAAGQRKALSSVHDRRAATLAGLTNSGDCDEHRPIDVPSRVVD